MTKKEKLLQQVNSLEKESVLPVGEQVTGLIGQLKENVTIKTFQKLQKFSDEIESFKKDFNLQPLINSIVELQTEIKQAEDELAREIETKLKVLPNFNDLNKGISNLSDKVESQFKNLGLDAVEKDLENLKEQLQTIVENGMAEDAQEKKDIEKKLATLKADIYSRISNIGGGNMNRQIKVEGIDVLTKYTDINFYGVTSSVISSVDTTNKIVNIGIQGGGGGSGTPSIGGGITGGDDGAVLFVHPASVIAQDPNFNYNTDVGQLRVGLTGSPFDEYFGVPIEAVGNEPAYIAIAAQNQNTGNSASTDFFVSADNDNSTLIGHYNDFGITGSGWSAAAVGNIRTVSVNAPGTGYTIGDILTLSDGDFNGLVEVLTLGGSGVATIQLIDNGTNYTVASGVSTTGGTGTGCTINVLSLIDFTIWAANDGYHFVSGGNFVIGTDDSVAGKEVIFHAGGTSSSNETARLGLTGLTVGLSGTRSGKLKLPGITTGVVTVQPASTAGTWSLTLPTSGGVNGQVLQTDGAGITSWGSAGGSGIVRAVSVITANITAAASATTDYVYFANAGIKITLPTAVGNSNLYTVKNTSASSILVVTSAGETIDGSASALLPTTNQSLDIISNGSIWGVI